MPLRFEPNEGQYPTATKFAARGRNFTLYLSSSGLRLKAYPTEISTARLAANQFRQHILVADLRFVGANGDVQIIGLQPLSSISNYFRGANPSAWLTKIPNFARAEYRGIYSKTHLVCYGQSGRAEFDWILEPGADPAQIRMGTGPAVPEIEPSGDVVLHLGTGKFRLKKPVIYQDFGGVRRFIDGGYLVSNRKEIAFRVAKFDHSHPLVIDPVLVYSTYFGGSVGDNAEGIAVDGSKNIYIAGVTASPDLPLSNPLQATKTGAGEAFVTKFNAEGSALIYSTYLSGIAPGHADGANAIAVDTAGNAYITGATDDLNFPTTPGAFLPAPGGAGLCACSNGWVAKLDPTGSSLIYSTYLTNQSNDYSVPYAIVLDSMGHVYLGGSGYPTGFPVTPGAYQVNTGGVNHVFVMELNPTGSDLVFSSLFGGNGNDQAAGIALDASGNPYVTGTTTSTDFPATTILEPPGEGNQAFVVKLNATGSQLVYSTVFGSGEAWGIAVDSTGSAYICGYADLPQFPTAGPMKTYLAVNGGFVSKLDPTGAKLIYSIFLGGSGLAAATAITLDPSANAYVTGRTASIDLPLVNPIQSTFSGGTICLYNCSDAFITVVSADGSTFLFSTYLGDLGFDTGNAIALDSSGAIYVAGLTSSENFPLANPFQSSLLAPPAADGANAFVAKISEGLSISPQRLVFGTAPLGTYQRQAIGVASMPQAAIFTNTSSEPIAFGSDLISGPNPGDFSITSDNCANSTVAVDASCTVSAAFQPLASGIRAANMQLINSAAGAPFTVSLLGFGSSITFTPPALTFQPQTLGTQSAAQTLVITNVGASPASINSVSLVGINANNVLIVNGTDLCSGNTLGPMGNCSVGIAILPVFTGPISASLVIEDTASDSPQSVPLTGFGAGPFPQITPGVLGFIQLPVGDASSPESLTLTNLGSAPLDIFGITVTGEFSQENNCPSSSPLAPGANCVILVTFQPTTGGVASGVLSIADNFSPSPQTVSLGGQGDDFFLLVSPTNPSLAPGSSTTLTATVNQKYGGFYFPVTLSCSGLPAEATCAFSPSSVTPRAGSAQSQLTISTTASLLGRRWQILHVRYLFALTLIFFSVGILVALASTTRNSYKVIEALVICFALWTIGSCGGGGIGGGTSTSPLSPGTPSGTYTITVTGSAGSLSHSQSFTLTVN